MSDMPDMSTSDDESSLSKPHPTKDLSKPFELTITDSMGCGDGFGYVLKQNVSHCVSSRKVVVPCTMLGDVVEVTARTCKRSACRGILKKIIKPSPQRVQARCPHFGVCGGCRTQHVSLAQQLKYKQDFVHQLFSSSGPFGSHSPDPHSPLSPLGNASTTYAPIEPSVCSWEYRNKMEFSFSSDAKGEHYLGLFDLQGRGRVMNVEVCYLVEPWMAQLLKVVRSWWKDHALTAYHPHHNRGCLRTLTLRQGFASGDRLAMLTVSGNPEDALPQTAMQDFAERMQAFRCQEKPEATFSSFVRIQQICKGAPTQFFEILLQGPGVIRETLNVQAQQTQTPQALYFHIGPTSFFQPNPKQAERLYSLALQMANLTDRTTLYDLCCGTATLGIAAAPFVQRVIGVELSPEALLDAKTNRTLNGCQNVTFHQGDVGAVVARLASEEISQEESVQSTQGAHRVVVVDPPRAGLVKAAHQAILALKPQQILSISCSPVSQASDVHAWVSAGYRLVRVQPVDCFPHTPHIENICLLER